jgi:hypothetical protein
MNKKQLILQFILFLIASSAFASVDFKANYFNNPPKEIVSYKFQGSKDNNGDGIKDEVYYKEGNKELLIEDTDFDRKVDRVGYSENGVLLKMEEDIDKDGQWDYRYWYKEGEIDRTQVPD